MINYEYISDALWRYQNREFVELDVPWLVTEEAINATIPVGCESMKIVGVDLLGQKRHLVASGEQSFIQMMIDGTLPIGKSMCCTPCFRDEKTLTETTRISFVKVELINYFGYMISGIPYINFSEEINKIVNIALEFMQQYNKKIHIKAIGKDLIDIEDQNGLELGSYGLRSYKHHLWIYGTGIAEPRFSISLKNKGSK